MRCELCNRSFVDRHALRSHINNSPAHALIDCFPCRRNFISYEALANHNRDVHPPPINPCPFCQKSFPSGPAALLMHLESEGACATRQGLTREKIAAFVARADKKGLLIYKNPEVVNQIVDGKDEEKGKCEEGTDEDVIELDRWECKQCPERGQFQDMESLLQHQRSPAHDPIRYHCPTRAGLAQQLSDAPSYDNDCECSELGSEDSWVDVTLAPGNDGTVSSNVAKSETEEVTFAAGNKNTVSKTVAESESNEVISAPGNAKPTSKSVSNSESNKVIQKEHVLGFKTLSGLAQHLQRGACNDGMQTFSDALACNDGMQTFSDALECVTQELSKMGIAVTL
ncbi:hypothetical protein DFS34DRAFT_684355 [Phlyctochytrium arcticum]|nr:hypothetical protein DFS34DRAFT_684355 [Phlyctochytrium arcticum]